MGRLQPRSAHEAGGLRDGVESRSAGKNRSSSCRSDGPLSGLGEKQLSTPTASIAIENDAPPKRIAAHERHPQPYPPLLDWPGRPGLPRSAVLGGQTNQASAAYATVSGGRANTADGDGSSISGGAARTVIETNNWQAGSLFQSSGSPAGWTLPAPRPGHPRNGLDLREHPKAGAVHSQGSGKLSRSGGESTSTAHEEVEFARNLGLRRCDPVTGSISHCGVVPVSRSALIHAGRRARHTSFTPDTEPGSFSSTQPEVEAACTAGPYLMINRRMVVRRLLEPV
jgi:hypothetical protein